MTRASGAASRPAPHPAKCGEAGDIDQAPTRIAAHPAFAKAARRLAVNMLAAAAGDEALGGLFKDGGRYVAGMIAVHVHFTGGLTLARFKTVGAASGLFSAGRARALFAYLNYLGFVERIGEPADDLPGRRPAPVLHRPTAAFLAAWRGHFEAALEATAIVAPRVPALLARFEEPSAFAAFARAHCEGVLEATVRPIQWPDIVKVFMHPFAGWQVVGDFLAAGGGDDFPSKGPIAISIAATARRFGVSRAHVRRMLVHAEQAGLLVLHGDAALTLTERGRSQMAAFYAFQLASLAAAAEKALAELDAADAARPRESGA